MIELGELERRHEDFARRHARVIVISLEGHDEARQTQEDFPHLLVLTDQDRALSEAVERTKTSSHSAQVPIVARGAEESKSGGSERAIKRSARPTRTPDHSHDAHVRNAMPLKCAGWPL